MKKHIGFIVLFLCWGLLRVASLVLKKGTSNSLYVVPCDPYSIVGSKGDEAMLEASVSFVKKMLGIKSVYIAGSDSSLYSIVHARGAFLSTIGRTGVFPFSAFSNIREVEPAVAIVMGADMMDGFYSPVSTLRMIVAADLMARLGAKTAFLGFSFNESPYWPLRYAFRCLSGRVSINLRDPVSLERFERFTGRKANLVADSAFLLEKNTDTEPVRACHEWIERENSSGRKVIALNFHPMLFKGENSRENFERLFRSIREATLRFSQGQAVSWILLPHDDREHAGDMTTLGRLFKSLSPEEAAHVLHVETPPTAAEIKGILSRVDGALTGRMHLAIAALGAGVPVMCLAYQDKFSGLMQHFGLPASLVLDPQKVADPDVLSQALTEFCRDLPELTEKVQSRLPAVLSMAEKTFQFGGG